MEYTGRKVESSEVTTAIATMMPTDIGPNTNTESGMPSSFPIMPLKMPHRANDAIRERIRQIPAMITVSEKKILNTSVLLAPTARRIPISFFLLVMETEMKLNSSSKTKILKFHWKVKSLS